MGLWGPQEGLRVLGSLGGRGHGKRAAFFWERFREGQSQAEGVMAQHNTEPKEGDQYLKQSCPKFKKRILLLLLVFFFFLLKSHFKR